MRRGFSMVEMVGVIAIIAVLASILFPAFAKAREKARTHVCRMNVLNIGMALRLYSADHDGWYPPTDDDLVPLIPGYLTDELVLGCPTYSVEAPTMLPADGGEAEERPVNLSYYYRAGRRHGQLPRAPLVAEYKAAHNDRANVLFSDGAIELLPESAWRELGFISIDEVPPEQEGVEEQAEEGTGGAP